jgi:hypothetical protein
MPPLPPRRLRPRPARSLQPRHRLIAPAQDRLPAAANSDGPPDSRIRGRVGLGPPSGFEDSVGRNMGRRSSILHPASRITSVQNRTTSNIARLKTLGLRCWFWPFRGEVPEYQLRRPRLGRQRQRSAAVGSVRDQRQPSEPAVSDHAKGHEPRSGDRCIAWGVSPRYRDEKDEKPLKGATEACLHQVQGTATATAVSIRGSNLGQRSGSVKAA